MTTSTTLPGARAGAGGSDGVGGGNVRGGEPLSLAQTGAEAGLTVA
jgi:hypothetical protein